MRYFRKSILVLIAVLILFLLSIAQFVTFKKKNLNLILISVDTLRSDHMGVYGYDKNTTPNIDKWAKDSYIFTNAYTIVPFTYPSFGALMISQNPIATGILTNGTSPKIGANMKTLASVLKESNYKMTAFITNRFISPKFSRLDQGFDQYFTFNGNYDWKKDRKEYNDFLNSSLSWLESHKKDKFFLWIHLIDPHGPYYPRKEFRCKFNKNYCNEDLRTTISDQFDMQKNRTYICRAKGPSKELIDLYSSLYDGDIYEADLQVKSILDKIQSVGLSKNSLIIIYGDHGEGFDHNYYFLHGGVLYNSSTKIPLIFKFPSSNKGKKIDKLIDNTDILPTVLDLLNIAYKKSDFSGQSFSNVFNNLLNIELYKQKNSVYLTNINRSKFGLIKGRYKLIYSVNDSCISDGQKLELYDMIDDLKEEKNMIVSHKDVAEEMKNQLFDYLSKYNLPQTVGSMSDATNVNKELLYELKSLGY